MTKFFAIIFVKYGEGKEETLACIKKGVSRTLWERALFPECVLRGSGDYQEKFDHIIRIF